ncbi:MAG: tRNA pseudouridine(38-40) synthase TruA [Bacilli bacterium]|nr:tRNA pseudouridine(38-40) synthase TruA [Bacilli bacterium]
MKRNLKLTIAYDGTRYNGFQRLGDTKNTIQEKLETCISRFLNEDIKIIGASRTDAGVHAYEQIINFYTNSDIDDTELRDNLNFYLPEDIVVTSVEDAPSNFHSRYWVVRKTYLYRIYTSPIPPLFERNYVYNLGKKLDVERMREASNLFIGEKDFQAFSKRNGKKDTIRTVYNLEIIETEKEVDIYITANSFLYNMVRIIVGTLIEVGLHKRELDSITKAFETCDRTLSGFTAPPEGLFLYKNYFTVKK